MKKIKNYFMFFYKKCLVGLDVQIRPDRHLLFNYFLVAALTNLLWSKWGTIPQPHPCKRCALPILSYSPVFQAIRDSHRIIAFINKKNLKHNFIYDTQNN